eukprot:scaffold119660_cov17-Tisochrysis_lutea.AAC.2
MGGDVQVVHTICRIGMEKRKDSFVGLTSRRQQQLLLQRSKHMGRGIKAVHIICSAGVENLESALKAAPTAAPAAGTQAHGMRFPGCAHHLQRCGRPRVSFVGCKNSYSSRSSSADWSTKNATSRLCSPPVAYATPTVFDSPPGPAAVCSCCCHCWHLRQLHPRVCSRGKALMVQGSLGSDGQEGKDGRGLVVASEQQVRGATRRGVGREEGGGG